MLNNLRDIEHALAEAESLQPQAGLSEAEALLRFMQKLQIIDKQGRLVPFRLNRSQELVFERIMAARELHKPARFICCKARQLGISTLIEAFIFALISLQRHRSALVVAHSVESAAIIFEMTHRFHRYSVGLPLLKRSSARLIAYNPPHESWMRIDTASNPNLGRGATLNYVHASEVAFWEKPEDPILAINQSVPQHWDSLVFWESTANGTGNLFHRTWIAAERGESEMEPIFLSWKGFPEYFLPLKQSTGPLEPEDERFATEHGLAPEQAHWARFTRINQCHNSWEKFNQEYPMTPDLAFIFSGMPWFDPQRLRQQLERAVPPVFRGDLHVNEAGEVFFDQAEGGALAVWEAPKEDMSYSLGMDAGEGIGSDYTVIQVICDQTGRLVASFRSNRIAAELAGVEAWMLGMWYNCGLLAIERNGPGLACLAVCQHGIADYPQITEYANLYYHTWTDRKELEETKRLGWLTNRHTKGMMLMRLARAFQDGAIVIPNKLTLLEMQGFTWDARAKTFRQVYRAEGEKLAHDDEIMALAIAHEMKLYSFETRFFRLKPNQANER